MRDARWRVRGLQWCDLEEIEKLHDRICNREDHGCKLFRRRYELKPDQVFLRRVGGKVRRGESGAVERVAVRELDPLPQQARLQRNEVLLLDAAQEDIWAETILRWRAHA